MAEQTFRSPGFFEREIDLSGKSVAPLGVAAGVIGTSNFGPAFIPVTIGAFTDFEQRFGGLNPDRFGPYAVQALFNGKKQAVTFMRVLGAGANKTATDVSNTETYGIVKNAGFKFGSTAESSEQLMSGTTGNVTFICADHNINEFHEPDGFPMFNDNDTFQAKDGDVEGDRARLVRAVVFVASGTRLNVLNADAGSDVAASCYWPTLETAAGVLPSRGQACRVGAINAAAGASKHFKLCISSSSGASFGFDEGHEGIRILTASLDPNDKFYIGNVLNTDPKMFQSEEHLLYADYAVESELADVDTDSIVLLASGSAITGSHGLNVDYLDLFGRFDTRYTTPKTPVVISQPYGKREYDLFHFETISDGAATNHEYKVSIANLRASTNRNDPYGSFDVQVRRFTDNDLDPQILELYPNCNLDPTSDRYVARLIGDYKVAYNFDAVKEAEKRITLSGKYPNRSVRVRIVMNGEVDTGDVPKDVLPFGFRGIPVLKTNDTLTDTHTVALSSSAGLPLGDAVGSNKGRLFAISGTGQGLAAGQFNSSPLTASIVPPLPLRFKCSRGSVSDSPGFLGEPGQSEIADARYYWGVKFTRIQKSGSVSNTVLNSNAGTKANPLIKALTKFQGISKLDTLVTGAGADQFHNNKFTLARVALANELDASKHITDVTGTANEHMLEACYVRNGDPDGKYYTVGDTPAGVAGATGRNERITLATLVNSSSTKFNRFQNFAKFTFPFYGGFDGVNILDRDSLFMKDRAASNDAGGKAQSSTPDIGLANHVNGAGVDNNNVASYNSAISIMTDEYTTNINLLAIPGMREAFITDEAIASTKAYQLAMYVMDLIKYDSAGTRLFDGNTKKPDPRETAEQLEARSLDNNYAATYFPDVFMEDNQNNRHVKVPASVAALAAIANNDNAAYPWYAPAGFNRGALDFVLNTETRLMSADRDTLYDAKINPIANFPNGGFVIFGQKTLQLRKSALDRVNVRRMMLEAKREIKKVALNLVFEQNTPATRARFVAAATQILGAIQLGAGIESFRIIMDGSNNTAEDVEAHRLNGTIQIVPTRTVEFIAIDFIVTNAGVEFV